MKDAGDADVWYDNFVRFSRTVPHPYLYSFPAHSRIDPRISGKRWYLALQNRLPRPNLQTSSSDLDAQLLLRSSSPLSPFGESRASRAQHFDSSCEHQSKHHHHRTVIKRAHTLLRTKQKNPSPSERRYDLHDEHLCPHMSGGFSSCVVFNAAAQTQSTVTSSQPRRRLYLFLLCYTWAECEICLMPRH